MHCPCTQNITFQLAVASTSSATYALFLYDGEEECNITVKTGFKTGNDRMVFLAITNLHSVVEFNLILLFL